MENNNTSNVSSNQGTMSAIGQILGRFIVAAIILGITAFFTPNFSISNIWALGIAAIVLTVMDYLIVKITGLNAIAFGKGFVGFVLAAITLYATQFFVAGKRNYSFFHFLQIKHKTFFDNN